VKKLPELHPAQQGLKLLRWKEIEQPTTLPELHPAQQGLKPSIKELAADKVVSSRTTSSTTRIETEKRQIKPLDNSVFQNYIQHNKD